MEGTSLSRKRPFIDDESSNKAPTQKRVRFPKGKKVKPGAEPVNVVEDAQEAAKDWSDPSVAAKKRAEHRSQMTTELFTQESEGDLPNISAAEVRYKDNETFVDDGIQIEPFNLNKEREEGYFDEAGNFVEYVPEKEEKDAWLDSIEVDPKLAERVSMITNDDDDELELSSHDIGRIKRRIANVLEPGETVLQALRRLKGHSNNKKEKMSAETKHLFDQLTEDAMKLMENGDYNVYHESQEVFDREAEGYERLEQARKNGLSSSEGLGCYTFDATTIEPASSVLPEATPEPSYLNGSRIVPSVNENDTFDMFAADDETAAAKPSLEDNEAVDMFDANDENPAAYPSSARDSSASSQLTSDNDYVYDESSGYYYNSSLGYYYDPSSGLYCYAASGQWYSYNEETGTYNEVEALEPTTS